MFSCKESVCILLLLPFAANIFAADWYARGKGYEKCMDDFENKLLICREDYVNNFCYGKERIWSNHRRVKKLYDRNTEMLWYDRKLVAVRNLNYKCEYHGWSKFKLVDGSWRWQCYQNNREMEDASCKGFTKR